MNEVGPTHELAFAQDSVIQGTPLLEVTDVSMHYTTRAGFFRKGAPVKAVDGVSLSLRPGETVGLVGESGCGKTTLSRMCAGLLPPTSGSIRYSGLDVYEATRSQRREFHRGVQIVFQDPFASLDPRRTIESILTEPLRIHRVVPKSELRSQAAELLETVGLDPGALGRRPRHFSGGQRQRISIARALALAPQVIVLDEPVSALDVSIQAQFLNLLERLKIEHQLSYLFVSHDLSVVSHIADRVMVMYLGKIVETGRTEEVFAQPSHPYTKALLSAIPGDSVGRGITRRIILSGEVPSATNPPSGCYFRTRCWKAQEVCSKSSPQLEAVESSHRVACYFPET